MMPRKFELVKPEGEGGRTTVIAEGIMWSDEACTLRWKDTKSTMICNSLDELITAHEHDGAFFRCSEPLMFMDEVVLKSGGPSMTVVGFKLDPTGTIVKVTCRWKREGGASGNAYETEDFSIETLKRVDDSPKWESHGEFLRRIVLYPRRVT